MSDKKIKITLHVPNGQTKEIAIYFKIVENETLFKNGTCVFCKNKKMGVVQSGITIIDIINDHRSLDAGEPMYEDAVKKIKSIFALSKNRHCQKSKCVSEFREKITEKIKHTMYV